MVTDFCFNVIRRSSIINFSVKAINVDEIILSIE